MNVTSILPDLQRLAGLMAHEGRDCQTNDAIGEECAERVE
jgi:hypothetical protein